MTNPLFDGQGIEFHHLQRARHTQAQAETNRLLRQQNELLQRAEHRENELRKAEEERRKAEESKQNAKVLEGRFAQDALVFAAALAKQGPSAFCNTLVERSRAITAQLTQGDVRNKSQKEFARKLHTFAILVDRFCDLTSTSHHAVDPASWDQLKQCVGDLSTVLAKSSRLVDLGEEADWIARVLSDATKSFGDTKGACKDFEEVDLGVAVDDFQFHYDDPSGVVEWYAQLLAESMCCVAAADGKLSKAECDAMLKHLQPIRPSVGERELRQCLIDTVKRVYHEGVSSAVRRICGQVCGLRGSSPAAFLCSCIKATAASQGTVGDREREIISSIVSACT